jgi:DNA-binding beta-propeller fold protein YncE/subtilisin family serine protease
MQRRGSVDGSKRGVLALCAGLLLSLVALLGPLATDGLAGAELPGPSSQGFLSNSHLSLAAQQRAEASSEQEDEAPYIVVLKDSVSHPGVVAQDQAAEVDGEVGFVYGLVLNGYSVTMPSAEVESLREDPRVKYVTPDHKVEAFAQTSPTGIQRIGAVGNEKLFIDEKDNLRVNADVAVIDSGVDYEHPDLNVAFRTNCVPPNYDPEVGECIDGSGVDLLTHGTHVAGTIGARDNGEGVVGVAPGARIWSVKVISDGNTGYESWIIAGVKWVTAHASQIEVANMSLGCKCSMPALDKAIEESAKAGIVYAIAAGNSKADTKDFSPAGNPDAITVSALADYDGTSGGKGSPTCSNDGADDKLASFSNFGADIDVAAPGVCILSTKPGGGYQTISGTSMASPHVAGAAALLASMKNPENLADVEAIRSTILEKGSTAWTDTSGDGVKEPLLSLSSKTTFAPADQVAVTKAATILSKTEATLRGEVNPGGVKTEYQFEYGTTTSYGTKAPTTKGSSSATSYTAVSQTVSGLAGKTLYHYRLVATNAKGTFYGEDQTFGTTPPSVTTGEASVLSANAAELKGTVNPEGLATTYSVEYGTDTNYGKKALVEDESLGSGTTSVPASGVAGQLNGNSTYHYRLVAANIAGKTFGADKTLSTPTADWHVDGAWEEEPGYTTNAGITDVSCVSKTECMAVGSAWRWPEGAAPKEATAEKEAFAERWDGKAWEEIPIPQKVPDEYLPSISCPSADFCLTAGERWDASGFYEGPTVDVWDGESWEREAGVDELLAIGNEEYRLTDVSCASESLCVVSARQLGKVGLQPRLLVYDGGEWSLLEAPMPAEAITGGLESVSCTSDTACIAVGWYRAGSLFYQLVEEFDGEEVTLASVGKAGDLERGLNQVSCWGASLPSIECAALGGAIGGGLFVRWYDGEGWSTEVPPSPPGAKGGGNWSGVSCNEAGDCAFTGVYSGANAGFTQAFVQTWNGASWSFETVTNPHTSTVTDELHAISCLSDSCVAAGSYSDEYVESIAFDEYGELLPLIESNLTFQWKPTLLSAFGTKGSGNGQLSNPTGIAIDSSGNAWVVDNGNSRVEKFNSSGVYQSQFGTAGSGNGQLSYPIGVAIDSAGNVWVADTENNRIEKFNSKGEYLSQFGKAGSGNGQFYSPEGIAIDSSGNVWVVDTGNSRVEKFNSSGVYQSQFGSYGSGNGQFAYPTGVAIDSSGNLWVTDAVNNRVEKFNSSGVYQSQFGSKGSGNGQLSNPAGIAIDSAGNLWVADAANNRVQKFNSKGEYLNKFGVSGSGEGQFNQPYAVAIDSSGNLWVADAGNNRVQVWRTSRPTVAAKSTISITDKEATLNGTVNPNDYETTYRFEYGTTTAYGTSVPIPDKAVGSGVEDVAVSQAIGGLEPSTTYHYRVVATNEEGTTKGTDATFATKVDPRFSSAFGTKGSGNGQLSNPTGIAIDSSGNAWVVDNGNSRVEKFNSSGVYQSQFGTAGSGNGQLSYPIGVAIDSAGNVWVADTENNRIEKFNSKGEYLSQFGKAGSGNGQFYSPEGIAIDSSGNVWVVDTGNSRVEKFNSSGVYQSQFGSYGSGNGQFAYPTGVAIDSSGNLWVTDAVNNRVEKFNSSGVYQSQFGSKGSGNGQLSNPAGIAIDSAGNLWVADAANNRVQKFNSKGEYLNKFGVSGSGEGQFNQPYAVAIDSSGNLWVADAGNNRVQVWKP